MLAADAELQFRRRGAAALDREGHQLADAGLVQALERVGGEDVGLEVGVEELARIVAREAERHLGEVVGAEAEEVGLLAISPACRAARGSSIMVPTW